MKKLSLSLASIFLAAFTAFAQYGADDLYTSTKQFYFELHGRYTRPVTRENLSHGQLISDIVPDYPVNWITDYISVQLRANIKGKTEQAKSRNKILSNAQKDLLKSADLGTDIIVDVEYRYKNPATHQLENNTMHVSVTVVPEIEARFEGGEEGLRAYLRQHAISKLKELATPGFRQARIYFTVDESGKAGHARIDKASGDPASDQLLLEAIQQMPRWSPAKNAKGEMVKQEFVFFVERNRNNC